MAERLRRCKRNHAQWAIRGVMVAAGVTNRKQRRAIQRRQQHDEEVNHVHGNLS